MNLLTGTELGCDEPQTASTSLLRHRLGNNQEQGVFLKYRFSSKNLAGGVQTPSSPLVVLQL